MCAYRTGRISAESRSDKKNHICKSERKSEDHFSVRMLAEGQVWKHKKGNWPCMIFLPKRMLFANKHNQIQEITDCPNLLLSRRVHKSLDTKQVLSNEKKEGMIPDLLHFRTLLGYLKVAH